MNSNFRNVDIKRAISKYVGITPFDDTILDVVKGLSNKESQTMSHLGKFTGVTLLCSNSTFYADTKIFLSLIQI